MDDIRALCRLLRINANISTTAANKEHLLQVDGYSFAYVKQGPEMILETSEPCNVVKRTCRYCYL